MMGSDGIGTAERVVDWLHMLISSWDDILKNTFLVVFQALLIEQFLRQYLATGQPSIEAWP